MLSKENEQFEEDLTRMRHDLELESKNKRKLEQVLRDAALAMKQALTVLCANHPSDVINRLA